MCRGSFPCSRNGERHGRSAPARPRPPGRLRAADHAHSVRLVQSELGRLENGIQIGQIGHPTRAEPLKINNLAEAAGVDIAGVASSILATPTIFFLLAMV